MIYFVRHGQTNDNLKDLLSGMYIPLNDTGLEQSKETAKRLKNIKFDLCFCSPLIRAKQTVKQILKYHKDLKVIYDDRLEERNYGDARNLSTKSIEFRRWNSNDIITIKGFESIDVLYERVSDFYNEILKKYPNKNILIVSHSGIARISNYFFNGKPSDGDYSGFYLKNAAVFET